MKIRIRTIHYSELLELPLPEAETPRRPGFFARAAIKMRAAPALRAARFSFDREGMEKLGRRPFVILMNRTGALDPVIAARVLAPRPCRVLCAPERWLEQPRWVRRAGCVPVFDTDGAPGARELLARKKCSVLLFPEGADSLDGRAAPLLPGLGELIRQLDAPVAALLTEGAFLRDPPYGGGQSRDVAVRARLRGLFTRDEVREMRAEELDRAAAEQFTFDAFAWQRGSGLEIGDPFRAAGLHRLLYQCPHCRAEGRMQSGGTTLICRRCGKVYEMTPLGELEAWDGDTEFPNIPDWCGWQRAQVRREIDRGTYQMDIDVDIGVLTGGRTLYLTGPGRLVHDDSGFTLTGGNGQLRFERPARLSRSLPVGLDWQGRGDAIFLGDSMRRFCCVPRRPGTSVVKARLAAEELYRIWRGERRQFRRPQGV